ncbi:MAG: ribosome recycling factor [Oscillospiraceae bacterium]|jgi:ribosome recycling factor|nr:ribosome recycling factor [Oscillospiraceae bacterium]
MDKYPEVEGKIAKTLETLGHSYATIRAGRANAAVLDRVAVDYYGTPTPVAQIASVSTPEPRILVIQPWDASALKNIEKAIQASDLGINPTNDGKVIRLAFPQLTEERRRDLGKQVHKYGEEAKVAVRGIRRDALELYKKQQKKSEITEDDLRDIERDLQEITDKSIKDIDALTAKKEKELMEV